MKIFFIFFCFSYIEVLNQYQENNHVCTFLRCHGSGSPGYDKINFQVTRKRETVPSKFF